MTVWIEWTAHCARTDLSGGTKRAGDAGTQLVLDCVTEWWEKSGGCLMLSECPDVGLGTCWFGAGVAEW